MTVGNSQQSPQQLVSPAFYNEANHRAELLQENAKREMTVLATKISSCGRYLVGGSSTGRINVWDLAEAFSSVNSLSFTPFISEQVHEGPIYDICFVENHDMLVTAGDDFIYCWRWSSVLQLRKDASNKNELRARDKKRRRTERVLFFKDTRIACLQNPQQSGHRQSLGPVAETNGVVAEGTHLFSAAGDKNAYIWDLEKQVKLTTLSGHRDYLHCIASLGALGQVVTGSEDGTVRFWDVRSKEETHNIDTSGKNDTWVSSLDVDDTNCWIAFGGGREAKSNGSNERGFVRVVHAASLTETAAWTTKDAVNAVGFHPIGSGSDPGQISSVGESCKVSHYLRNGKSRSDVSASAGTNALYCLAMNPKKKYSALAVGGAARAESLVDIFVNADYGNYGFSMKFD
eukprot:g6152.t1